MCYIYREDLDQHLDSLVTKYPDHPSMQAEVCLIRFCLQVKHKVVSWILPVQEYDIHHQAQTVPSAGETGNSKFVFTASSRGMCVLWFCPQVYKVVQVSLSLSVQMEVDSFVFFCFSVFLMGFVYSSLGVSDSFNTFSHLSSKTSCFLSLAVSHRQGE